MTLSFKTLDITTLCHYAECRRAEFRILFIVMLNVVMLSVIMLSVVMLNVIMLSVMAPNFCSSFITFTTPLQLMNGTIKLERYITLDWKGLSGANTLAHWTHF